jgi:hypothetical protein
MAVENINNSHINDLRRSVLCARAAAAADIKNNTHLCASGPAAAPFFDIFPLALCYQ